MNAFGLFILIALLAQYVVDLVANLLNLRALRQPLPQEFADTFDEEAYEKSQTYTATRTRFGLVKGTFDLALLLAFWLLGGFAWLDGLVRGWELPLLAQGLAYIGILFAANLVLGLPWRLYSTFVIEERFGFNKTTLGTFVGDTIKGLVLAAILGVPFLALVLWFFQSAGSLAWLYVWVLTMAFQLFVLFIAPTWIMPLFNKFEELDDQELREKIFGFAKNVGFQVQNIFVIDGSRRSSKANAFFTGFGKNKRIALFDTLLDGQEHDEVVAVVGHEIGHYQMRHIPRRILISFAQLGVTFWLMGFFLESPGLHAAFGTEPSVYVGLLLFSFLYSPLEFFLGLADQAMSRKHEFEADDYAAERVEEPEALVRALKKLSRQNLGNLTPHPFFTFLHYTHPPVLQRIENLRQGKLGQGAAPA